MSLFFFFFLLRQKKKHRSVYTSFASISANRSPFTTPQAVLINKYRVPRYSKGEKKYSLEVDGPWGGGGGEKIEGNNDENKILIA